MSDQADTLRAMVRERVGRTGLVEPNHTDLVVNPTSTRTRTIAFVGAKGGVGTTNLVLNLAVALQSRGQRVAMTSLAGTRCDFDLLWRVATRSDGVVFRETAVGQQVTNERLSWTSGCSTPVRNGLPAPPRCRTLTRLSL